MKSYLITCLLGWVILFGIQPIKGQIIKIEQYDKIAQTSINGIVIDHKDRKWVGTIDSVLLIREFEDSTQTFHKTGAYSISQDYQKNIWIGLRNNMLHDKRSQKDYPITATLSTIFSTICVDPTDIYIGTPQGMMVFSYKRIKSQGHQVSFTDKKIYTRKEKGLYGVNVIISDEEGNKWIGSEGGLFKMTPRKKLKKISDLRVTAMTASRGSLYLAGGGSIWRFKNFREWEQLSVCDELTSYRIEDMAMDKKGNLWMASNVLAVYDTKQCHIFTEEDGFNTKHALCIAIDKNDVAWIGTEGKGLFKATFSPFGFKEEEVTLKDRYIFMQGYANTHLVLLLDVSSSMNTANKLPKLKESVKSIVQKMRPEDKVSIVAFSNKAQVLLPPTSCTDEAIEALLDSLVVGGRSNLDAGISTAYDVCLQNYIPNGNNRIILATDGKFQVNKVNIGKAKDNRKQEVSLTVFDFGSGYNAELDKLAEKSGGTYKQVTSQTKNLFSILEKEVKSRKN